jgi:hypothetical protein
MSVIQKDFIAMAGFMFEQSFKNRHLDIIQKCINRIDDTDAPMIDLAAFRKLTDSELETAQLDTSPRCRMIIYGSSSITCSTL